MPNFPLITHIIYDMDGILLDTEPLYTLAAKQVLSAYGKTLSLEMKANMMGRRSLEAARLLIDTLELPIAPEDFVEQRKPILTSLFQKTRPMPGAQNLSYHLASRGIPQAIATSSDTEMYRLKMEQHVDWMTCFRHVIRGDNPRVLQGKPSPDIFLLAAEMLGADPTYCLVFEDAPAGVAAARAAGMSVVAIPSPELSLSLFQEADQILSDFGGFVPEDWGLPAYAQEKL